MRLLFWDGEVGGSGGFVIQNKLSVALWSIIHSANGVGVYDV